MRETSAEATSSRGERWALPLLLLALLRQALSKAGPLADSDGWWHLRTGDLILEEGSIPATDPFSWTAAGERWQPNAWLSDVLLALIRQAAGPQGVALLRSVAVVAIGILIYLLARRTGARPWPAALTAAVVTLVMNPFIAERPQLFGFVLLPLVVLAGAAALEDGWRAPMAVAGLVAAWVNLHGSFIVGVGVVTLMAATRAVRTRRWNRPALVAAAAAAAALLNPFQFGAYREALRISQVSTFIEEWRPLDVSDGRGLLIALLLAAAATALLYTGRWHSSDVGAAFLALAVLTVRSVRAAPFALVVGAPEIALALPSLASAPVRRWAAPRWAALVAGVALGLAVLTGTEASTVGSLGDTGAQLPTATVPLIPPGCRLLNEYEFGGYVIDSRWPEVLVAQDGRNDVYGLERLQDLEGLLGGTEADALEALGVDCVLARPERPLVGELATSTGWRERAAEEAAVLYVRQG